MGMITGVLPDNVGVEEEHWKHPLDCSVKLATCTIIFFISLVAMVQLTNTFPEHVTPGTWESMMKRASAVAQLASAMAMAWCLLFAARWEQGRNFEALGSPNTIMSRMVLAVVISICAFLVITLLDKMADSDYAGATVEEAIRNVISSIGILVGFSWEGAFEGGVDVLARRAVPSHPVIAHLMMAGFVSFVVITPWRRHILQKVIDLERERERGGLTEHDLELDEPDQAGEDVEDGNDQQADGEDRDAAAAQAEADAAKPFSAEGSSLQSEAKVEAEPKATNPSWKQNKQPKWVDEERNASTSFSALFNFFPCCKNATATSRGRVGIVHDPLPRYPELAVEADETP